MMLMFIDKKNEDLKYTTNILINHGLEFRNEQELIDFLNELNRDDRFLQDEYNEESNGRTFCYFGDSDVIYTNMLRAYPHLIKCRKDLQTMSWWEFKILFDNIETSASDRVHIRSQKLPTGNSSEDTKNRRSIEKAKSRIRIREFLYKDFS